MSIRPHSWTHLFTIERSANGRYVWQTIGTLGANTTPFTDSGLSPSTTYAYRVRSFNDVGSSFFPSNVATATTQGIAALAGAAPSNLAVASISGNVATLTWTDNSGNEEGFLIQHIGYAARSKPTSRFRRIRRARRSTCTRPRSTNSA